MMDPISFKRLWVLTQVAPRDNFGYYVSSRGDTAVQIYQGRNQINICVSDDPDFISIANVVFDGDEAVVYPVSQGVCDYNSPRYCQMEDPLRGNLPLQAVWVVERLLGELTPEPAYRA